VVTVGHKERGARQPWRLDEAAMQSGERGSGWLGKKVVVVGPKDRMGRLAAVPIGPKVKEKFFFK
jgi:hypothetical protein